MRRTLNFPFAFNRHVAPRAIAHKGHQLFARALFVAAAGRVATIGILSRRLDFEATTIAPGAVGPIALQSPPAARTIDGVARGARILFAIVAAPRTGQHGLRHRALAFPARTGSPQGRSEIALELFAAQLLPTLPPRRTDAFGFDFGIDAKRLLNSTEAAKHLLGIAKTRGRVEFQRFAQ